MPVPKIKVRKKPTNRRCQEGYPCKTTCISKLKNCRGELKHGQARTWMEWLKLQEERLIITNQKRQKAGLSPARMTEKGYITAERTKITQPEKAPQKEKAIVNKEWQSFLKEQGINAKTFSAMGMKEKLSLAERFFRENGQIKNNLAPNEQYTTIRISLLKDGSPQLLAALTQLGEGIYYKIPLDKRTRQSDAKRLGIPESELDYEVQSVKAQKGEENHIFVATKKTSQALTPYATSLPTPEKPFLERINKRNAAIVRKKLSEMGLNESIITEDVFDKIQLLRHDQKLTWPKATEKAIQQSQKSSKSGVGTSYYDRFLSDTSISEEEWKALGEPNFQFLSSVTGWKGVNDLLRTGGGIAKSANNLIASYKQLDQSTIRSIANLKGFDLIDYIKRFSSNESSLGIVKDKLSEATKETAIAEPIDINPVNEPSIGDLFNNQDWDGLIQKARFGGKILQYHEAMRLLTNTNIPQSKYKAVLSSASKLSRERGLGSSTGSMFIDDIYNASQQIKSNKATKSEKAKAVKQAIKDATETQRSQGYENLDESQRKITAIKTLLDGQVSKRKEHLSLIKSYKSAGENVKATIEQRKLDYTNKKIRQLKKDIAAITPIAVPSSPSSPKGKYKKGETIYGLGKITEVFDHGDRGFQYKIGNDYFHERVLDGSKDEEFKEKWITPSRLTRISRAFDVHTYSDKKLQDTKKAINTFFDIYQNAESYVKNLGDGVSSVNAEMKFLIEKGFYSSYGGFGHRLKEVYLPKNLTFISELIDKEINKRASQSKSEKPIAVPSSPATSTKAIAADKLLSDPLPSLSDKELDERASKLPDEQYIGSDVWRSLTVRSVDRTNKIIKSLTDELALNKGKPRKAKEIQGKIDREKGNLRELVSSLSESRIKGDIEGIKQQQQSKAEYRRSLFEVVEKPPSTDPRIVITSLTSLRPEETRLLQVMPTSATLSPEDRVIQGRNLYPRIKSEIKGKESWDVSDFFRDVETPLKSLEAKGWIAKAPIDWDGKGLLDLGAIATAGYTADKINGGDTNALPSARKGDPQGYHYLLTNAGMQAQKNINLRPTITELRKKGISEDLIDDVVTFGMDGLRQNFKKAEKDYERLYGAKENSDRLSSLAETLTRYKPLFGSDVLDRIASRNKPVTKEKAIATLKELAKLRIDSEPNDTGKNAAITKDRSIYPKNSAKTEAFKVGIAYNYPIKKGEMPRHIEAHPSEEKETRMLSREALIAPIKGTGEVLDYTFRKAFRARENNIPLNEIDPIDLIRVEKKDYQKYRATGMNGGNDLRNIKEWKSLGKPNRQDFDEFLSLTGTDAIRKIGEMTGFYVAKEIGEHKRYNRDLIKRINNLSAKESHGLVNYISDKIESFAQGLKYIEADGTRNYKSQTSKTRIDSATIKALTSEYLDRLEKVESPIASSQSKARSPL